MQLTKLVLQPLPSNEVAQSCPTLRLPGSSVHGIFQARVLEWVAISFSRVSSQPRDWTHISCIGRGFLYHQHNQGSPISVWGHFKAVLAFCSVNDAGALRKQQDVASPCATWTRIAHYSFMVLIFLWLNFSSNQKFQIFIQRRHIYRWPIGTWKEAQHY